jgi:hypothetical protein
MVTNCGLSTMCPGFVLWICILCYVLYPQSFPSSNWCGMPSKCSSIRSDAHMLAYVFLCFLDKLFANFSGFVDHVTVYSVTSSCAFVLCFYVCLSGKPGIHPVQSKNAYLFLEAYSIYTFIYLFIYFETVSLCAHFRFSWKGAKLLNLFDNKENVQGHCKHFFHFF